MEPVMKIDSGGITHYLFHPERVLEIRDVGKPDKLAARMYFNRGHGPEHPLYFQAEGITARDLKRSIQENVPEKIGFLKLDYNTDTHGKGARRYVNVDHLVSLHPTRIKKQVDGQTVTVGATYLYGVGFEITVEGAAYNIAWQIRRVLKRLDQDEEFCCDAPAAEAEAESEE